MVGFDSLNCQDANGRFVVCRMDTHTHTRRDKSSSSSCDVIRARCYQYSHGRPTSAQCWDEDWIFPTTPVSF